jgi:hypothetical protein
MSSVGILTGWWHSLQKNNDHKVHTHPVDCCETDTVPDLLGSSYFWSELHDLVLNVESSNLTPVAVKL